MFTCSARNTVPCVSHSTNPEIHKYFKFGVVKTVAFPCIFEKWFYG